MKKSAKAPAPADEKISEKILARAAKAAYERFVKEAGYEHDARIKDWEKLAYTHQHRWVAIARAVIEASRGEADSVRPSGIRQPDDGPRGLRPSVAEASSKKSATRGGGTRRR